MILYVEKTPHQNIARIHKFSKAAEYKTNVQKSVLFLYTNSEAVKSEIKESIPFIIAPKIIKYLRIN